MDKSLIKKLLEQMELAKNDAKCEKRLEEYRKAQNEKRVYDYQNETVTIKEKYVSTEQYFMIARLYTFLKENPNLSNDEVEKLLNSKLKFRFLARLVKTMPNMMDELRLHGPRSIAFQYADTEYRRQKKEVPLL